MEAVIVAVITGGFGLLGIVLNRQLRSSNSAEHAEVRRSIADHSVEIGVLTERVDGVREDVREMRDDLRHVRDLLADQGRDSQAVEVHEHHLSSGNGAGSPPPAAPTNLDACNGLGVALGGWNGHGANFDGNPVETVDLQPST